MFDKNNEEMLKNDKILNNSFNTGDITYEAFTGPIKIHSKVIDLYEDQLSDDLIEVRTMNILQDEIYDFFLKSPFHKKYKNPKRVDKSDMVKMYYYFKERLLKKKSFTTSQIFIGFAEFFQINYDQLYSEIGVLDKESLLRELNEKYSISHKIKTKRLF